MKDLVLFAVSVYLLKQDVARASLSPESARAYSDHKKTKPRIKRYGKRFFSPVT
jgi:hypothetical protein